MTVLLRRVKIINSDLNPLEFSKLWTRPTFMHVRYRYAHHQKNPRLKKKTDSSFIISIKYNSVIAVKFVTERKEIPINVHKTPPLV